MFAYKNLTKVKLFAIIISRLMAHYSSQFIRQEDGDKLPLKSISMKPFVFALDAQSGVDAGDENTGQSIMAYV